ncbi:transcription elongation factor S-II [Mycena leptocephala]|nr:transcription elongation factor S-II [Mycena leptocephala]
MAALAELKALVKGLQSASTTEDLVKLLGTIDVSFTVNESILRESKAALAVGRLRMHASKTVSSLAKQVVKRWKADVEREKAARNLEPGWKQFLPFKSPTGPTGPTPNNGAVKSGTMLIRFTGDQTRNKCIDLLYDGLVSDSGAPVDVILTKAQSIEAAVFASTGGTTKGYVSRIRSLFVNLQVKRNQSLRKSVASGDIPVEKFVKMVRVPIRTATPQHGPPHNPLILGGRGSKRLVWEALRRFPVREYIHG